MSRQKLMAGLIAVAIIVVSLLSLYLMPAVSFNDNVFRYTIGFRPGQAVTRVSLPPFGRIEANTHSVPVSVAIKLDEVNVDAIAPVLKNINAGTFVLTTKRSLAADARTAALVSIGWVFVVALVLSILATRRLKMTILTTVSATLIWTLLLGSLVATYDVKAIDHPNYHGVVAYAPKVVGLFQRASINADGAVRGLYSLYKQFQIEQTAGNLDHTRRILVVSDIHLDPIGFRLTKEFAKEFNASGVIDIGDVNTLGSNFEAQVVQSMLKTPCPQIFVPGNHDSPPVVAAVKQVKGIKVLEDGSAMLAGVKVYGLADPISYLGTVKCDDELVASTEASGAERLRRRLASGESTPDVVAVHNPTGEEDFAGLASVVVTGHTHRAKLEHKGNTWYLGAGTTGGFGASSPPWTAAVLYFDAGKPNKLIAIDQLTVGRNGEFSLARQSTQ